MPASSQASSALSTSSLTMTSGQSSTAWPVCAVSSFDRREVEQPRRREGRACELPGGHGCLLSRCGFTRLGRRRGSAVNGGAMWCGRKRSSWSGERKQRRCWRSRSRRARRAAIPPTTAPSGCHGSPDKTDKTGNLTAVRGAIPGRTNGTNRTHPFRGVRFVRSVRRPGLPGLASTRSAMRRVPTSRPGGRKRGSRRRA